MNDIDTRALAMSDDERESYLEQHGWRFAGAGWFAPGGTSNELPGGVVVHVAAAGGMFCMSSAIREQFAREAGLEPDVMGRCYRGTEPDDAFGRRW